MRFYDLHCHLLPGLDDGAYITEDSLEMARMAADACTECIVCTPHMYPDMQYTARDLIRIFRQTDAAVRANGIRVRLLPGQEIFLNRDIVRIADLLERGALLTINRTAYPLVEVHPAEPAESVYRKLSVLTARGFVPILAHPERYGFVWENPDSLRMLKKAGVRLQINKDSITGRFGHEAREAAHYLLSMRLADFAASDAHGPYHRTTPLLRSHELVSEQYSAAYADLLFTRNPFHVLRDEAVEIY